MAVDPLTAINIFGSIWNSFKSKPESPFKTGGKSSTASVAVGAGSALLGVNALNELITPSLEVAAQSVTSDPVYDLIMSILGLIATYGLSQYRKHH
jgi:hypothetical protein